MLPKKILLMTLEKELATGLVRPCKIEQKIGGERSYESYTGKAKVDMPLALSRLRASAGMTFCSARFKPTIEKFDRYESACLFSELNLALFDHFQEILWRGHHS
jgi:hypothetical protein